MYDTSKYAYKTSLAEQANPSVSAAEESVKLQEIRIRKKKKKSNRLLILSITVFGILLGMLVYRYSYITELNYSLEKAKVELNNIENKNSLIKVDIEENLNLNAIRSEAQTKYKMRNPKDDQKVYLRVKRNDISVVDEVD